MADGRLIALEGTGGPELHGAARRLLRHVSGSRRAAGGISAWDASGIFTELALGDANDPRPRPRTLTLLYAADLAFRLRWEIRPAVENGQIVVAAPYVDTAIALGRALGLSHRWLSRLFAFAPVPHDRYRLDEPSPRQPAEPAAAYLDFCCHELKQSGEARDEQRIWQDTAEYLAGLERRGRCRVWKQRGSVSPRSSVLSPQS